MNNLKLNLGFIMFNISMYYLGYNHSKIENEIKRFNSFTFIED